MKKYLVVGIVFSLAAGILFYFLSSDKNKPQSEPAPESRPVANKTSPPIPETPRLNIPLEKSTERITKKPFGIYITPQNSPVQPERFAGFHTGTDFEILPGEENQDVPVFAVCGGKVIYKSTVSGYGGVIIQACAVNNETVTVLYGHLSLAGSPAKINSEYKKDDQLAVLGRAFSAETGGERKHLHLGIHKGARIDFRGYVQNEKELDQWLDFQQTFGLK